MENFKSDKGNGIYFIIILTALCDALIIVTANIVNSYEMLVLARLLFIVFNVYQLYYFVLYSTINYTVEENMMKIKSIFGLKTIAIPMKNIKAYNKTSGNINGVKLTGYGSSSFALGKLVIDKIGSTQMFVTSNKNIYYLNTEQGSFGISPKRPKDFEKALINNGIELSDWESSLNNESNLYKQKEFIYLLSIISIIVIVIIANPMVMYLNGSLSSSMPLNFDATFTPIRRGTGKQFAIKQATYGVLNMAVLFCMYYAAHFCYKYDKRTAYRYLYISLLIACAFLVMQIKILSIY